MRIILIPIRQSGVNLQIIEEQQHQISKMVGDGWQHRGTVRIFEERGTEIECVRLTLDNTEVQSGEEQP